MSFKSRGSDSPAAHVSFKRVGTGLAQPLMTPRPTFLCARFVQVTICESCYIDEQRRFAERGAIPRLPQGVTPDKLEASTGVQSPSIEVWRAVVKPKSVVLVVAKHRSVVLAVVERRGVVWWVYERSPNKGAGSDNSRGRGLCGGGSLMASLGRGVWFGSSSSTQM